MNKKLVAVAVAGVLAAPLAAQAQTANVTLYGRLNLDYGSGATCKQLDRECQRHRNTTNRSYRVSSNSSRFGVRGTESLGGGLNAIFQIESSDQRRHGSGGSRSAAAKRSSACKAAGARSRWATS